MNWMDRRARVREIADESRGRNGRILQRIRLLREAVDREPEALRQALSSLGVALALHFEEEEQSLLYRWIPEAFPDLGEELHRLRGQHGKLLSQLEALAQEEDPRSTASGVRMLVSRLQTHEAAEHLVLRQATFEAEHTR